MRYLEHKDTTISELAGNYDNNITNTEVRMNEEVKIRKRKT